MAESVNPFVMRNTPCPECDATDWGDDDEVRIRPYAGEQRVYTMWRCGSCNVRYLAGYRTDRRPG